MTARNPTLTIATQGYNPKPINTEATTAASAHGFKASDHPVGTASTGTVSDAGRESVARAMDAGSEKLAAAITGSSTSTRICGAMQWGQKGRPSSTDWPHL